MNKISNLIGLPVLALVSGLEVGRVREVVLDYKRAVLCGVIVSEATWFDYVRGILYEDIVKLGANAISIHDTSVVRDFSKLLDTTGIHALQALVGKELYSVNGNYLGILADFMVDMPSGCIKLIELSDGLVTDFIYGRTAIPLDAGLAIEQERLVVSEKMYGLVQALNDKSGEVE
ncbi:MAG: PRC-barrel domain protein [Firmicutes bacterium]|nr:PRC-barrel domain protein [Bacillota bacterium]